MKVLVLQILLAQSMITTSSLTLPRTFNFSLVHLEAQTIAALEQHAGKLQRVDFKDEPLVIQTKLPNGTLSYSFGLNDSVLFTSGTSKAQKDVIVIESDRSNWAIPTPRGASIRQFVLLKKLGKQNNTKNEAKYYMTFVFAREPRCNESNTEMLNVSGVEIIPEYDIWEERTRGFYFGWHKCEHTVLFTCDEVKTKNRYLSKRNIHWNTTDDEDVIPQKVKLTPGMKREEKHKNLGGLNKEPKVWRPIKALPGHEPEDYRDLYLDLGFHRRIGGEIQLVEEGERKVGISEKAIDEVEKQVVEELHVEEQKMKGDMDMRDEVSEKKKTSKDDEGGETKKKGKGGGKKKIIKGADHGYDKKKIDRADEGDEKMKKAKDETGKGKKNVKEDKGGETKKSDKGDEGDKNKKDEKVDDIGENKKGFKMKPKIKKGKKNESMGKEESEDKSKSYLMAGMEGNQEKMKEMEKMGAESDNVGKKHKSAKKKGSEHEQTTSKPRNAEGQTESTTEEQKKVVIVIKDEEAVKNTVTKTKKGKKSNGGKDDERNSEISEKNTSSKHDTDNPEGMNQTMPVKKSKNKKEPKNKTAPSRRKRSTWNDYFIKSLFKHSVANLTTGLICKACTKADLLGLNAILLPENGSNVTNVTDTIHVLQNEPNGIAVRGWLKKIENGFEYVSSGYGLSTRTQVPSTPLVPDDELDKAEFPEIIKVLTGNDTEVGLVIQDDPTVVKDVNGTTKIINTVQIISETNNATLTPESGPNNVTEKVQFGRRMDGAPDETTVNGGIFPETETSETTVSSIPAHSEKPSEVHNDTKYADIQLKDNTSFANKSQDVDAIKVNSTKGYLTNDFEEKAAITEATASSGPERNIDLKGLDNSAVKLGGGFVGITGGTPATTRGSIKAIATNYTSLELENNVEPIVEGSLNLGMVSGDIASSELNESKSHNVWDLINYDELDESTNELNKSGVPLNWAKLMVLGIKLSIKAQTFINEKFENGFDNFGGHVATAVFGTYLNGGVFRGVGLSGPNSISNRNNLYGAFYGGRPRMFFFPIGAIIKAEIKFRNGGLLQGYMHVGAMRHYDNFYFFDDNKTKIEAKTFFNMDGILYPNGFPNENYRVTGILCTFVEPNLIKIRGVKTLGMYDPSDSWFRYRVWMPKEFAWSVTTKNSLRWIRVKNGRLPRLTETKVDIDTTEHYNLKPGYPSWTDISWTQEAKLGMLYSGGGGKQIYLPMSAMVRAEFIPDGRNESEPTMMGFYVSKKAHDYFHPDDEKQVIYGRGKVIPVGFDRKLGIAGELKKNHEFQCDTQKVKMIWETDHSLYGRVWLPEGALAVMYKLGDKNLIMPKEAMVKTEIKMEGKSATGLWLTQVPGHDDQFFPMKSQKITEPINGVKAKILLTNDVEVDGTYGPDSFFIPDLEKIKVIYNPRDEHWKNNTLTVEGTPVMTFQVEKRQPFLLPLMTSFRADFKGLNGSVSGWFRCGRARSLDWFYPDNETKAEKLVDTNGKLRFLDVEVIARLHSHNQIHLKANKSKGIFNLNDPEIKEKYSMPKGSLGLIYKGGGGKHYFLKEGTPVNVQFRVYESDVSGIFIPRKVGYHDVLRLDPQLGSAAFDGVSGKVVPVFNNTKEDSGKVGISGTFLEQEIFHVSVKFHAVLNLSDPKTLQTILFSRAMKFDDTNDIDPKDITGGINGQNQLYEIKETNANSSNDFGIKEGYIGVLYRTKENKRVFIPKGVMTKTSLKCNSSFVNGNLIATEPGHPDMIYLDKVGEIKELVEGNKCQMFPVGFNHTIGVSGTLRESGIFQAEIRKEFSMYDPSNPLWATNTFVPRGKIGTVYKKDEQSKPIFASFGSSERAILQLSKKDMSIVGDFIATESVDYFYPDDEILAKRMYNELGIIKFNGMDKKNTNGISGVLKSDNIFETLSSKMKYLVDQTWRSIISASEDSVNEMNDDLIKVVQDPLRDTKWTWDSVSGMIYEVDENKLIFHPHSTMVWSEFRAGDKAIFGFHYSDEDGDRFFPDNDDLIKGMLGLTGYVIPVGLDKAGWGIPATLSSSSEDMDILNVHVTKSEYELAPADFYNNSIYISNGAIGVLYGGDGDTRQFFLHNEAFYRVEFKFGNISIPGTFFPVGPDRLDGFEPDPEFEVLAKTYHGRIGRIIPNAFAFTNNGNYGIDAWLRSGNLVEVKETKSKIVMNPDDVVWLGKMFTSQGTLGILYNNPDEGKMFFLKQGTVVRAELRADNGSVYGGFYMANVPEVADEFQVDNENELKGEVRGQLYFEIENNFGIKGIARGTSFQPLTRKVKVVFDPNDASWKGKVVAPEENFGVVFADAGASQRKLFFEPNSKIRAMYKTDNVTVWGFFQINGPGHCDLFFPDNETETIDLHMSDGTIVPEVFSKTKAAIFGTLFEGNKFLTSAKVKANYNHKDPFWRKQVWSTVPPKAEEINERPGFTLKGKKIVYGYLFQGMEESPHVFVAEGDSLSGFFLPIDDCYPEVTTASPHGVLTPTHPAGHAIFVADTEIEFGFIKEIRGVFMVDALGLTASFSGLLSLIEGTKNKYCFVLDRPATEFVYIVGSPEARSIWNIYLNPKEWTFDLPEMKFSTSHVSKRHAIGKRKKEPAAKKKKKKDGVSVRSRKMKGRSFDEDELDMDESTGANEDNEEPVKLVEGVKIVTRKTFAFIPYNFTVIGVVTTLGQDDRLISATAELLLEAPEATINIIITSENFTVTNGSSGMFIPQGYPVEDAIVGNLSRNNDLKIATFIVSSMANHTWNKSQNIWTPVGFQDKMSYDNEYAQEAEQEAKRDYSTTNPLDLNNSLVPGVLPFTQPSIQKPRNFRFGPLYQRDSAEMESDYINLDGLHREYIHGVYIKAVESPEPIFVPDTGIRGKFTPLTVTDPLHGPVTGYYFPERGDWKARFVFENQTVPAKIQGRFEAFNANGGLSRGFFYASIGENTLILTGEVEIVTGWEMSDLPKLKLNDEGTQKYLNPSPKLKYALIDITCGYKGIVADSLVESIDDPNNPLFQAYLMYKAQRDGDVNPWGRVAVVDPVIRYKPGKKGYIASTFYKDNSMFYSVLQHFSLKRWDLPRSIHHRFSKGTKENIEPLKLGNRLNVVNLLDFRMFLYSKYILRRGNEVGGKDIWVFVPVHAEACLSPDILTNSKPEVLDWVVNDDNKKKKAGGMGVVETEKYISKGFATFSNIDLESLKMFEERKIGDEFLPEWSSINTKINNQSSPPSEERNFDKIKLEFFQITQIQGAFEADLSGVDLGFQLIQGLGNTLTFTEVAQKFIELMDHKRIMRKKQLKSQVVSIGRSTGSFETPSSIDTKEQNIDTETATVHLVKEGWKTQYRTIEPNVTLADVGQIFYGLGNCERKEALDKKLREKGGATDLIDYYLKVFRVDCHEGTREKLIALMNEGYIELDPKHRVFKIPKEAKGTNVLKLAHEELKKLSVAFEFYSVTKTYHHQLEQMGANDFFVQPHCTISRSMEFLTEWSFYSINRILKVSPAHGARLIRNLLATLKTVLTKLHQDWLAVKDCKQCEFDRTLTEGDKFRVVSLIEFIIHGMGAFETGEKALKTSFREFVTINLEALQERSSGFGEIYLTEGGFG